MIHGADPRPSPTKRRIIATDRLMLKQVQFYLLSPEDRF